MIWTVCQPFINEAYAQGRKCDFEEQPGRNIQFLIHKIFRAPSPKISMISENDVKLYNKINWTNVTIDCPANARVSAANLKLAIIVHCQLLYNH